MVDFILIPLQGTFNPDQEITFQLKLINPDQLVFPVEISLTIWHLFQPVDNLVEKITTKKDLVEMILSWSPPAGIKGGFGVQAELFDAAGFLLGTTTTAFDILGDWTEFPRYGFLCDFFPNREDVESTVKNLLRYHVNGLQYYDWQYRHDQLITPEKTFIDPLGRELSLETITEFLHTCKKYGIKSMPYMAVYAASLKFWKEHPEWALYDAVGKPYYFEDFLGIMDPSSKGPWIEHIKRECDRVLSKLPFDGIHIDQYGEPREGQNSNGDAVDLPASFNNFINDLKLHHPDAAIVFNAVKNWPIESLATSQQDFMYIEIWPPNTSYKELGEIVSQARTLSGEKPIVIAAYIPAKNKANVRVADAIIFAHGGTRIEFGEGNRLLADPYFPKHEPISPDLNNLLIRYYDFLIRYGDLIGPNAVRTSDIRVDTPPEIETTVCKTNGYLSICLVNQTGIEEKSWDQEHSLPDIQKGFRVEIDLDEKITEAWWGTPDQLDLCLQPIPWEQQSASCQINIPLLDVWGVIVIKIEGKDIPV